MLYQGRYRTIRIITTYGGLAMNTLFSRDQAKMPSRTLSILLIFCISVLSFVPYAVAQDYTVIDTLYAGDTTQDVDVNPVTNRIYVAALGDNAVYVIDGDTNAIVTAVPVGVWPRGVAVDVDTNRIFVGNSESASVSVIDGSSNSVIDTIPVGSGPTEGMKLNPKTERLYVTNFSDNTVSVIDIASNTVVDTIPVGSHPAGVAINTNSNVIYVSNRFEDTVSVIDGNTNTVIDTINVGFWPAIPDYNSATNRLYLPIRFGEVWVFDGATNSVIDTIPAGGPIAVTVDSSRNHIYVINRDDSTMSVVDGFSNEVVDSVPIGPEAGGIEVNPVTNRVYATHQGEDTLSVIADAIQLNPYNDHYYKLVEVEDGIDWYGARDAAASSTHNGMYGHLATLTSPEEDQFLVDTFPRIFPEYVWLGATDEEQEGNWLWITGEPWSYTKWDVGEPNGGTSENCLDYSNDSIGWNDESCDRKINFYVVEYDGKRGVDIDIKPGNKQNVINPRAKGGIWVAILSDTDAGSSFDPSSQVDIPTVELGPDGAKAKRHKVKDINKDGLGDLLLRFKIPQTGIACGDIEATLTGETFDDASFTGTDTIKTVGCKHKKHK